jgi:CRAL/TRIO, N-terminal domain
MAELTKVQSDSLEKMRQAFPDPSSAGLPLNDATFLRYLRARSFDFTKASAMLNSTIQWRRDFGLEEMSNKEWNDILAKENCTGKMYARGLSLEGHPLLYMRPKLENTNDHDGNIVSTIIFATNYRLNILVFNLYKTIAEYKSFTI